MLRGTLVFTLLALLPIHAAPKKKKTATLAERAEKLIAETPALSRGHLGVRLVDLSGKVLYEHNPRSWFVPASNTKLYSSALALARLGPDYRITTRVRAAAEPDSDGVLHGDLRLVGGGDPSLSGRAYPYDKEKEWDDTTPALEQLADQIAARGIKRITGSVIGDDTAYVFEPFPDGWSIDDPLYEYGAPVSALTLNDNSLRLEVRPAETAGAPAEVYLFPDAGHLTVISEVETIPAGQRGRIRLDRPANTNELRIYGTIPAGVRPYSTLLAVPDPALYAAQVFADALRRRGIEIRLPARALHRIDTNEAGGDSSIVLAERQSPPLIDLMKVVNKVSQNLHAELLLREVGRQGRSFTSREAGVEALQQFLQSEIGLQKDDINFLDGSGMSRLNLLTPEATTKLLVYMAARPGWYESLPTGGEDGTLSRRFTGESVKGKVHAKTGSLSHVSALGGYLDHPKLGRLAFTVVLNNYNPPTSEARAGIDKLVATFLE